MHVTAINEKRGHELGIEQEKVCGMSWKEEKKGKLCDYNIISKIKEILLNCTHYIKNIK